MNGRWSQFVEPAASTQALVVVGAESGESNKPGYLAIGAVILGALVVRHMVKR